MAILKYVFLAIIFLFFLLGGYGHFADTERFVSIMPPYMPFHYEAVYISGVFELLGAFGILWPKTRRLAGIGLFTLIVLVTPANIHMWWNADQFPEFSMMYHYIRLPGQLVLLFMVWWAAIRVEKKPGSEPQSVA
ncbi:MAG: DoxX family protein [Kordiimonadaceae bacterium]|nr:DoxX family protein [Kordiimonadaceae bacterium]